MSKPTPPAEARVRHLVASAERAHQHQLEGARDRFTAIALDILEHQRVRNASHYRQRLQDLGDTA